MKKTPDTKGDFYEKVNFVSFNFNLTTHNGASLEFRR